MENKEKLFEGVKSQPLIIVLSAPSGAGKTTLCNNLLKTEKNVERAITCTTRTPRTGEIDGVDYYFLAREQFELKIKNDEFLEYANVYGNYYGTLKKEAFSKIEKGKDVLLNIDVQGAANVRKVAGKDEILRRALVTVFVGVESLDVLENRLKNRGLDDEDTLKKRLRLAKDEIKHWKEYDYLIISASMEEDLNRLRAIVNAERLKIRRMI